MTTALEDPHFPMPESPTSAEFDTYAANYEEALHRGLALTGEGKDFFAKGRVLWLKRQMERRGARAASCLDFGCGTGTAAPFLQSGLGITSYIGYDPSSASIERATKEINWPEARFMHDPGAIAPESVDLAFTNGVFHHIPPDQRAAAAHLVWRTLKPGGLFAFWENNRWNPIVHYLMSKVPFDADAQMLFPFQSRALLRAAGFKILQTDSCFVFPSALGFLRGIEPLLCKIPVGGQYLVLAQKL